MANKIIKTPLMVRAAEFDRAAISEDKRTVDLSFSSESPVERWFGVEILDHAPGSADLSRLNAGGALLMDHSTRDQVGVVESATVGSDRKGRATVRFGKSQRAQEIFQDVKDGIRRLVSVGYRIDKMVTDKVEKGLETFRATAWTPLEISIVSVPADATVGIGRADETHEKQFDTVIEDQPPAKAESGKQKAEIIMKRNILLDDAPTDGGGGLPVLQAQLDQNIRIEGANEERKRSTEINAIGSNLYGKVPKIEELAREAIQKGWSVEQFRAKALDQVPTPTPTRAKDPLADVSPKEWNRYSLSRAIIDMTDNRRLSGFEAEVSQEIAKRSGPAMGFWIPPQALLSNMQRSLIAGTGTLGGMTVETSNLGDQFIELLRNRTAVMRLGARSLMLDNPVTIPQQNAAGQTNWVGETTASTLSTGNFTQITLTPKGISAFQQYSKQLLATSNPSIDQLVRDDITQIIALAIDLAALHGTGSSQPTGIANISGIGSVLLATNGLAIGNSTAYPAMVSLESAIAAANADAGSLAFMMTAKVRGQLRGAQRFTSTDTPVFESAPGNVDGVVAGYRAAVSNQVANNLTTGTATTITSPVFFGNWNELLIGHFNGGATDLVVDPYTLAVNGVVRLIARNWVDINVRHAASFALLGGILNG